MYKTQDSSRTEKMDSDKKRLYVTAIMNYAKAELALLFDKLEGQKTLIIDPDVIGMFGHVADSVLFTVCLL